jgi:Flp pilus assembly protein TadG
VSFVKRTRRGNQAIEFALVMPVLLAVVAGTIDWGFFWHAKFHLVNSVHVGARSAAVTGADDDPLGVATSVASTTFDESGLSLMQPVFTSGHQGADPDIMVWVTAVATFEPFIGFIPTPAGVEHTVTMRMGDQDVVP